MKLFARLDHPLWRAGPFKEYPRGTARSLTAPESPRRALTRHFWGILLQSTFLDGLMCLRGLKPARAAMVERDPVFIDIDELSGAADALAVSTEFLEQSLTDVQRLRWALIAMHEAIQCVMVCAVSGSSGIVALNQRRKDVQEWAERLRGYAEGKGEVVSQPQALDHFMSLYEKTKDESVMRHFVESKPFVPGAWDDTAMHRLNDYRNRYIHVLPGGFLLEVALAIDTMRRVVRIIEFLAFESKTFEWKIEYRGMSDSLRESIARSNTALEQLNGMYP